MIKEEDVSPKTVTYETENGSIDVKKSCMKKGQDSHHSKQGRYNEIQNVH